MKKLVVILISFLQTNIAAYCQIGSEMKDPLVEAQEKLIQAKGSYKTVKEQESAIKNLRKATRLSLKAAGLRARAEKLQARADTLVQKANQTALSRGLYINNPAVQTKDQAPPSLAPVKSAKAPTFVPVPGQPINIIVPKQEEVTYDQGNEGYLPEPPQ